ncbi:MAG: DUF1178 family protein [Erythrobacter sp.]|jgi:hypothetical protein|nr:DUF1178 family protein [Erythrobacter sp.]
MIVFDLSCSNSHQFEGWFGSSADYESQRERGLLSCPQCGCEQVAKAPMAPAVPAKSNGKKVIATTEKNSLPVSGGAGEQALPPKLVEAMKALARVQAETIKKSTWVGEKFAEQSRAMHYGEADEKLIHGEASLEEAQDLIDEGIAVAPLLVPVTPPDELN